MPVLQICSRCSSLPSPPAIRIVREAYHANVANLASPQPSAPFLRPPLFLSCRRKPVSTAAMNPDLRRDDTGKEFPVESRYRCEKRRPDRKHPPSDEEIE